MNGDAPTQHHTDYVLLSVGLVLIILPLIFVVAFINSIDAAGFFLRLIASLGGALVGSAIPGLLQIHIPGVRAAGALAVLIMFWQFNPPQALNKAISVVTKTEGPITIQSGQPHAIPLSLSQRGEVEVMIQSLTPDWKGFKGQKGMPGQDGLMVNICSSKMDEPCPQGRQIVVSQPFSRELPAGSASVSLFNFGTSPPMTLTLSVKHPK